MHRVTEEAKKFVQTWTDVGELLEQVTPDARFPILQHDVEVLELRTTDEKGKTGTYVLQLFPEARPHPDPEGGAAVVLPPSPPPETPNAAVTDAGNHPDLLTEDGQVRMTVLINLPDKDSNLEPSG